ncbi:hypothetical protein A2875_01690 [Candidatus Gottesmanbacteria bacterium RIFCSPHIGHO2_01_FULL_46_14]|uniref:Uncharacterized protein n=2 Tax=Candidatus Gottesmaniibacteriota TaxID=1752720 RepID=A0A1F5ZMY5_9BACT|nr:MAG: hypothetical protein A2875_01690 [Candidatus Gottesmanbacteria bacterium RIFCSPHIGHO2_01_FULL_46_14]OGG28830.1 MAG: hypothetical protein A2971_02745 [Candidatus Gottesmanbacteria bacterium RIFCSPLOWO2_01_FULL_46_21]
MADNSVDGKTLFVVDEGVNPQGGKELVVSLCALGDFGCPGAKMKDGEAIACGLEGYPDATLQFFRLIP